MSLLLSLLPRLLLYCIHLIPFLPNISLSDDFYLAITNYSVGTSYLYKGYFLFTKLLSWLSLGSLNAYIFLHICIGGIFGPYIYFIAEKLSLTSWQRWLAVIATSFLPYYVSTAFFQPQFSIAVVFFIIFVFYSLQLALHQTSLFYGFMFALISVTCILFRPYMGLMAVCIFAIYIYSVIRLPYVPVKPLIKQCLVIIITTCVCVIGSTTLLTKLDYQTGPPIFGYNLLIANNPYVIDYALKHDESSWLESLIHNHYPIKSDLPLEASDQIYKQLAFEYMFDHPWQALLNIPFKLYRFLDFRLDDADRESRLVNALYTIPYVFYFPLFLIGFITYLRKNKIPETYTCLTILSLFLVVHLIFHGAIRHRMYIEFLLIIFATVGLKELIQSKYLQSFKKSFKLK